jgi:uncharacterized protein DUF4232
MTDVDDELRELFERKAFEVPPHTEVPPTLRTRSRLRLAANGAVAVIVVLALGGGAIGALQLVNRAGSVEPGGSGVTSSAAPPASTIPACTAGQVRVDANLGGAVGSVEGAILVSNDSSTRCTLTGYPSFTLLGSDLTPVRGPNGIEVGRTAPQWKADALPRPKGWPLVTLKPGGVASVRFRWSNWCGTGSAATPLWKIRIPGSGRAPIYGMDGIQPPPCNGSEVPSTISIGPFEPAAGLPQ